jgi:hypothetical protein
MADFPYEIISGPPIGSEADYLLQCAACCSCSTAADFGDLLMHEEWCSRDGNRMPMPGRAQQ